jgi:CRISPR system Cascade subunit CasA
MSRFNLIDEPWIPVRYPNGDRAELGIRDALLGAKGITAIEDPSPLVVAALHRFLLAVLYRALEGPTDIDQAKGWFKAGLPADEIAAYMELWKPRFDLFDEKYPFFQIADFDPKKWSAWTVLAAEHNTNQAKVLFDHTEVIQPKFIPASAAARWLLAAQTFAFTGNSELGYASFSPSANAVIVIPVGRNLEDTLLLNLVNQNREVMKYDKPVWEVEPDSAKKLKEGISRRVMGHAHLYTWPSRAIRLMGSESGVSQVAYAAGVKVLGAKSENATAFFDPMLAYRIDIEIGKLPRQFSDRGLWREFHSLLPGGDKKQEIAPLVIEHATELTRRQRGRFPKTLMALGLSNVPGQAKINYWRMERFALPETLVSEQPSAHAEIKELLSKAEEAHDSLNAACESFAKLMLSHGERKVEKKDIKNFVRQMPASASYWSQLEVAFHDTLHHYTLEREADEIRLDWLKTVRAALRDVWAQHAAGVSTGDAWAIRALVRAEGVIEAQRKVLSAEIRKYEHHHNPHEETA